MTNRRPERVRFRDAEFPVTTWRDAFVRLLTEFESASPGLLGRLATEGVLPSVLTFDETRFQRSKAWIGSVQVNTHGSAKDLWKWCLRIAEAAGIASHEFECVLREPTSKPSR